MSKVVAIAPGKPVRNGVPASHPLAGFVRHASLDCGHKKWVPAETEVASEVECHFACLVPGTPHYEEVES